MMESDVVVELCPTSLNPSVSTALKVQGLSRLHSPATVVEYIILAGKARSCYNITFGRLCTVVSPGNVHFAFVNI
jgi:hypothetical protein